VVRALHSPQYDIAAHFVLEARQLRYYRFTLCYHGLDLSRIAGAVTPSMQSMKAVRYSGDDARNDYWPSVQSAPITPRELAEVE
jgi:hypothetical protein